MTMLLPLFNFIGGMKIFLIFTGRVFIDIKAEG
jgi:hypothetical protein